MQIYDIYLNCNLSSRRDVTGKMVKSTIPDIEYSQYSLFGSMISMMTYAGVPCLLYPVGESTTHSTHSFVTPWGVHDVAMDPLERHMTRVSQQRCHWILNMHTCTHV